jgi:hypothetical protein
MNENDSTLLSTMRKVSHYYKKAYIHYYHIVHYKYIVYYIFISGLDIYIITTKFKIYII